MSKLKYHTNFTKIMKSDTLKNLTNMRDLISIVEGTECQTPGANYKFKTTSKSVTSTVTLPFKLDLTEEQVKQLEDELHDALEQVFKQFWKDK